MIANTPWLNGKRTFCFLLMAATMAHASPPTDHGWREIIIPSFDRPPLHEPITGSSSTCIAVARDNGYETFEYATTRGAWRWARDLGRTHGRDWLASAKIDIRRDRNQVIDRILVTGDSPLLASVVLTPAFYQKFEPLLGDGFHMIIPDRRTIALYPRLGGNIPAADAALLLEINRLSTYPVSREVFRVTRNGLVADGILTEE